MKLAPLLLLLLTTQGCIEFYSRRSIHITVKDGETQAPIAGCRIVDDPMTYFCGPINVPSTVDIQTDAHGQATVHSTTWSLQEWTIHADRYADIRDFNYPRSADITVYLYRGPAPSMIIILPNGYRGPVAVEMIPVSSTIQGTPGQRHFEFHAAANGYVRIEASPLLMRMEFYESVDARYEDGRPVPFAWWQSAPDTIALRPAEFFTTCEDFPDLGLATPSGSRPTSYRRMLFCVGTQQDEDNLEKSTITRAPNAPYVPQPSATFDRFFHAPPGN